MWIFKNCVFLTFWGELDVPASLVPHLASGVDTGVVNSPHLINSHTSTKTPHNPVSPTVRGELWIPHTEKPGTNAWHITITT